MDRSQIGDGQEPDYRWTKARLEMEESQIGDGQKPAWRWTEANKNLIIDKFIRQIKISIAQN